MILIFFSFVFPYKTYQLFFKNWIKVIVAYVTITVTIKNQY